MKKWALFVAVTVVLAGCNSGLNKSIMEPLSIDDLKVNIKKDTTFEAFYENTQTIRKYLNDNDVKQAKYAEVTYKRLNDYQKKISDTTYVNKIVDNEREKYNELYPDYSHQVDSIITYWRKYKEENSLDSLVSIRYKELWKEYYSYSGDVKAVNIGFSVKPLKAPIEQLIFRYCIKTKISNDSTMSLFDSHRCVATTPMSRERTLYWEADYSDEKRLKNLTSAEVARDYDFNIELVEVRINGENMSERLERMPESVSDYIRWGDLYEDDVIRALLNPNYQTFYQYVVPAIQEAKKKLDPLVFDLLNEVYDSDDED